MLPRARARPVTSDCEIIYEQARRVKSPGPIVTMTPTQDPVTHLSRSPAATELLGERLGRSAQAGDILYLAGELGAGKTCFVRGLARGLDSPDRVSSPTFVLVNEYRGRERLFHVDLYRLSGSAGLEELGLWDYAERGVLAIEWPERAEGALPQPTLTIAFQHAAAREARALRFTPGGARGRELLASAGLA
jgi:tRNA threonylcarbamoyladenosine biosynthesis protein TsaE